MIIWQTREQAQAASAAVAAYADAQEAAPARKIVIAAALAPREGRTGLMQKNNL